MLQSVVRAERQIIEHQSSKSYRGPPGVAGFNMAMSRLTFSADSAALADGRTRAVQMPGGDDVVLFHACCHNPCGVSPDAGQWKKIADLAAERGFLPLVDMAYQGFEAGIEEQNLAVRLFAGRCPEIIVASSCSKNFAVYRDRVGAISIMAESDRKAAAVETVIHSLTRKNYSMPPAHGPAVSDIILHDPELTTLLRSQVAAMRDRINGLRAMLVEQFGASGVDRDFSFLRLSVEQVRRLRGDFSIYTADSARVNVAYLNHGNIDYFVAGLKAVPQN